jgi:polar amino acid transport system substrate-binding protein
VTNRLSTKILRGLAAVAISALAGMAIHAKDLQIFTEENRPLNYSDGGKVTGFTTEVVQELQKRMGTHEPIQVVPWARGYQAAQEDPDTMLFSTMRIDEREKLFKWVGPLTIVKTSFYGKKGAGTQVHSLGDAKKLASIGVPRAFYSEQFLKDEGFKNLDIADNPAAMLKKFTGGRDVAFVSHEFTLPSILAKEGVPESDVVVLYTFMEKGHYLAFSLKTSDEVVRKWQKTLDEMKKDGSFAKLFNKWLPGKKMPR